MASYTPTLQPDISTSSSQPEHPRSSDHDQGTSSRSRSPPLEAEPTALKPTMNSIPFLSRANLLAPVSPVHGDLALLACSFVTGLLDSATFNNWQVFVGMQTGNTVILGLSTAKLPANEPNAYATTLVSLSSFFVGALFTAVATRAFGPLRRVTLTANFFLQAVFIAVAAGLAEASFVPKLSSGDAGVTPSVLENVRMVIPLPPLAFQFGAQIATSRMLGYNELPVNVLTSGLADLATDANLLGRGNAKRNRRFFGFAFVLIGAICGAWMQRRGTGVAVVFWLGFAIKMVTAVCVGLFLKRAEADHEVEAKK